MLNLHSSPAYQFNCLQLELLIDYELYNPFCFGAMPSLDLSRILAQYKYYIYIIIDIYNWTIINQFYEYTLSWIWVKTQPTQ